MYTASNKINTVIMFVYLLAMFLLASNIDDIEMYHITLRFFHICTQLVSFYDRYKPIRIWE